MSDLLPSNERSEDACEGSASRFYPSEMIRYANIDGLCVVLDMVSENYFIFNEQATAIWYSLVEDSGRLERARCVRSQECTSRRVAFIDDCARRNFLVSKPPTSHPDAPRTPLASGARRFLVFRAFLSLLRTAFSLRVRGFSRTYADYAGLNSVETSPDVVRLRGVAEAAFLNAENIFSYRRAPHDCLPRSLAMFRFFRSLGVPVVHRIGGRRVPTFFMHAWVEHDGVVILDDPRIADEFSVIASIGEP